MEKITSFLRQFVATLMLHRTSYELIREKRPDRGLLRYGWLMWVCGGVAMLLGFQLICKTFALLQEASTNLQAFSADMSGFFHGFSLDKLQDSLLGGYKYLVLLLLEIVVFHVSQRTLQITSGVQPTLTMKAFFHAQLRMVRVTIIAFLAETILTVMTDIGLDIVGLDILQSPVHFLVQCYCLGFAFVDSYHECFGLKVRVSEKRTRKVAGVAVAIGMVAYLLMFLPLLGVVASAMIGAVTASLAMQRFAPLEKAEA